MHNAQHVLTTANYAVVAHVGKRGIVHTLKRVEAHGALLATTRASDYGAAKDNNNIARALICCVEQTLIEIELGIGKGVFHRLLRTGKNNGLGALLHQIRKCRRTVRHGVGAMQDYKAIVGVVSGNHSIANAQPSFGLHVSGVDVHELLHVNIGELGNLRHSACKLVASNRRGEAVTVLGRSNGSACCNKQDALHVVPFLA